MDFDHKVAFGATQPALAATLEYPDGTAFDLSDPTVATVWFRMHRDGHPTEKVNAEATVEDAAGGQVSYPWTTDDLDERGRYRARWFVRFADDTEMAFPMDRDLWLAVT